jgi:hypothetical protein
VVKKCLGDVSESAIISEIRGENPWSNWIVSIVSRIQNFEQKVTKRTKRVMYDENWSSLPSFPSVKLRNDRIVSMTLLPLRPPVKTHPRLSAPSAEKSVAELDLWIEAASVLFVSSCEILIERLKNSPGLQLFENTIA